MGPLNRPHKVVLVDDSSVVRSRLAELLSQSGVASVIGEADNVDHGCRLIEHVQPDVVVLDMEMPGGNGLGLLRRLRDISPASKVIVLTNYPFPAYRSRCLELGADYFLDKTLEFEQVIGILGNLRSTAPIGTAPIPEDESAQELQRLLGLLSFQIMDTPAERAFDDLTELAALVCDAPIALISMLDSDRQWFRSRFGLPHGEALRTLQFCTYTVAQEGVFVVRDAHADPRFASCPLVVEPPRIRFYAGVPLRVTPGQTPGTLCILDRVPRDFPAAQGAALQALARQAVNLLGYRRLAVSIERANVAHEHAIQRLRESEARLRTLVNCAPLGVFMADAHGTWNFASDKARGYYRLAADVPVANEWLAALEPEARSRIAHEWTAFVASEESHFLSEHEVPGAEAAPAALRVHAVPILDGHQRLGFVGTVEDMSAVRALENRLRQAQKMEALGAFTSGVAHDFNNILATILGYTSLAQLRLRSTPESPLTEYLANIQTAGHRGRDLILRLLAFSRSAPEDEINAVDVAPILRESAELLRAVIPPDMTVEVALQDAVPPVRADPGELQQAIFNLAINARDACTPNGTVRLVLARQLLDVQGCASCGEDFSGDFVVVSCLDTGRGIRTEDRARIFEPFFTTRRDQGGTGLGLAVIHGIVHRRGGHIRLGAGLAGGTCFDLLLPPGPLLAPREEAAATEVSDLRPGGRILVIDDELMLARYLEELLTGNGFEVVTVTGGPAALQLLAEAHAPFDLIVSDLSMPEMTGEELASALRARGETMPILLCSGYPDPLPPARCTELGIVDILQKPVDSLRLLRRATEIVATAKPGATPPD